MHRSLVSFILACLTLAPAAATPVNDNLANAAVLLDATTGSNATATAEPGEPAHAGSAALHSVWWNYLALATGRVEIETYGSSFDTRLAVYTGNAPGALTLVAENDDHSVDVPQSRVVIDVTAGTVYRVAVDGFGDATGVIALSVLDATSAGNDDFANAGDLGNGPTATATGHNVGATAEAGEPPHAGREPDVSLWWKWTAPATGDVTVHTLGSSVDTVLGVYTGSAVDALTLVAENDDGTGIGGASRVEFSAVAGVTYFLVADAVAGVDGDYAITLEMATDAPPANDAFAAAEALAPGIAAAVVATNAHATVEAAEPFHANKVSQHTVWWTWTPLASGTATLSTAGSAFDTLLAVYEGASLATLAPVVANDDAAGTSQSEVTFAAVAGTTYHVAVGGYAAEQGALVLTLSEVPLPPANDAFAARSDLGSTASVTAGAVTFGATAEPDEPAHAGAAAQASTWWTWTCPADEYVTLSTAGSDFDTRLAVYTGTALETLALVAANDDALPARTSVVNFFATAGTRYVFAIDGKNGDAGVLALALAPTPPPANDDVASAAVIAGLPALVSGLNFDATAESGEPAHAGQAAAHSVWWRWTPTAEMVAVAEITTSGSDLDTRLAIYTAGVGGALVPVAANDDDPVSGAPWSLVRFRAHPGTTYFIAVDGANATQGTFSFALAATQIDTDNDAFAQRIDLGAAATAAAVGNNFGATAEAAEPAHAGEAAAASVWWKWTAPTSGWFRLSGAASDFPVRLGVYAGGTLAALQPAETDGATAASAVVFLATAGVTYAVGVDGVGGAEGDIVLDLAPAPSPAGPGNDAFASAAVLDSTVPLGVTAGSTRYATAEPGEPTHGGVDATASAWFRWTAPSTGPVRLDGTGMAFSARLALYTGAALEALVTEAETTSASQKTLEAWVLRGVTYYIAIDTWGGPASGGAVTFSLGYVAPAQDAFALAADLGTQFPVGAEGNTSGATAEAGEPPHAGESAAASLWWTWTAAAGGLVTIDTHGSEIDTVLAVYTGSTLGTLVPVAANDNAAPDVLTSEVTFQAAAGTVYRVVVDGFEGAHGDVSLSLHSGAVPVRPANDDFAAASDLADDHPVSVTATNANATAEASEPNHADNTAGASVWWKWTAPVDAEATVDTLGSTFDTVLAVYTGSELANLTLVAANDDATGGTLQSAVSFPAVAGTVYWLAVDGFAAGTGTVSLHVDVAAPTNDQFAHAAPLGSAAEVAVTASNAGATAEVGEPAHAGRAAAHTVWWTWTAPATGAVDVHTFGSEFDTVLAVYTGAALDALSEVAANDDASPTDPTSRVVFSATAGTVYRVAVGSADAADTGEIDLVITPAAGGLLPVNDAFAGATALGAGFQLASTATTENATAEPGEPDHVGSAAHDSVWWRWTAPFVGTVTVDTLGSSFDTRLAIYTGGVLSALSEVVANDDADAGVTQSRVTFAVTAGTTYRFAVDGFAGASGQVTLNLLFTPGGTPAQVAFAEWSRARFPLGTAAEEIGGSGDPDGDGVPNGIEFLLGRNPTVADAAPAVTIGREDGRVVLSYPRSASVPAGLEVIEVSTDARTWSELPAGRFTVDAVSVPGHVVLRIQPLPGAGSEFYRLRTAL